MTIYKSNPKIFLIMKKKKFQQFTQLILAILWELTIYLKNQTKKK
jgi:hypothetical protein